jgi:tetratricopeptide (TPR) repeat protein
MLAEAQSLLQEAELCEKIAAVPDTASPIEHKWPIVERFVLEPVSDSAQLGAALADVTALARDETDANAMYAQALLEFKAGAPSALASLTKAAKLLPADFVNVYYWRARARLAAGDLRGCLEDCRRASAAESLRGLVRYVEGSAHFGLDEYENAADCFVQAIAAEPDWREAHQALVLTRTRLGQWDQAVTDCDRAIQVGISDSTVYAVRAESNLHLGFLEQALADCSNALTLSVESSYPYKVRGLVYFAQQRWADAIVDLSAALKLDDRDGISHAYRADAYRMEGKLAKAIEDADLAVSYAGDSVIARTVRVLITLRRSVDDHDPALLEVAERDGAWITSTEPASAWGYWTQALVKRARGKTDEGLRLATLALEHDDKFARAYQTRGWLHFDQSAPSKAVSDFLSAIECGGPADASTGETYFGLAECRRIEGDIPAAIASYDKAIALAPNYAWAYYGRGIAYYEVRNWTAAIESYTAAITQDLRIPDLFRMRAWAYYECGRDADALSDFARAHAIEPSPINVLLEWGFVLVVVGRAGEGIEKASEALKLDPKSDRAYSQRGWARALIGDLGAALDDETRAVELKSTSAANVNNRAWVLCKLDRWSDAVTDCDAAIELDKSLDYAFKNRAFARWSLGQDDEALSDLTEIVRLRLNAQLAPATDRADRMNWLDEARDWEKAFSRREPTAVGYLGHGIALWIAGQAALAEEKIRRAVGGDRRLQTALDVLSHIENQRLE